MNHRQNEDDVRNDVAESLISGLLELELGKRQLGAAHHEALEAVSLRRTRAIAWLSAAGIILALAALATVMLYQPTDDGETPPAQGATLKSGEWPEEEAKEEDKNQEREARDLEQVIDKLPIAGIVLKSSADVMMHAQRSSKSSHSYESVRIEGKDFDAKALKEFVEYFSPTHLEIYAANLKNADLLPLLKMKTPKSLKLERMPDVNDPLIFRWAITGDKGGILDAGAIKNLKQAKAWCAKLENLDYEPKTPEANYFYGWGSEELVSGYFGGVTSLRMPIRTFGRLVSIDNAGKTPRHSAFEKLHTLILRPSDDPGISDENMEELFNNIVARDPRSSQLPTYLGILSLALEVKGGALSDEGMEYLTKGMIVENKQLKEFSISRADKVTMESLQKLNVFTFPALERLYLGSMPGLTSALLLHYKADTMSEPSTLKRLTIRYCSRLDDDGLVGIEKVMPDLGFLDLTGTMGPRSWTEIPDWSTTPHVTDAFCRKLKAKLPKCKIIGPHGHPIETQFLRVAYTGSEGSEINKRPDHLFLVRKSDRVVMPLTQWENQAGADNKDWFFYYGRPSNDRYKAGLPVYSIFTDSGYLAAGEYELIARHKGKAIANIPVTIKEGERTEILFDWANAKDAESPLANPTLGLEIAIVLTPELGGPRKVKVLITSPQDGHWIAAPNALSANMPWESHRWSIALNAALKEVQVEMYGEDFPLVTTKVDITDTKGVTFNWDGEEWKTIPVARTK